MCVCYEFTTYCYFVGEKQYLNKGIYDFNKLKKNLEYYFIIEFRYNNFVSLLLKHRW